jgi:peptidylprolyl isomerase
VKTRIQLPALLAAAAIAVAGCGGGGGKATTADIPAGSSPSAPPPPKASSNLKDTKTKPAVPKQKGAPPKKLVVKDIVAGKGRPAKKGDRLTMQYVGVSWSTGEQFDASWDRGQPFPFQLGAQMVIPGWDKGMVGMRQCGRRLLVIPPDLGYGPAGQGPIAPNETLVFVVDLQKLG